MAQAGMHALLGTAVRRIAPKQEWFMLGVLLGSLFPDLDNYAVAVFTVAKLDTHGLHRTFTHSLFTILAAVAFFFIMAQVRRQVRWINLGLGFGLGIGLHMALDLLIWFNGVELLWPLGGWVNLWEGIQPAEWFAKFLNPAEFLFLALYFVWLFRAAKSHKTNTDFLSPLRLWTIAMVVMLLLFTPLSYLLSQGFLTVFGAAYLIGITAAFVITIRMRETIETTTSLEATP